MKVTQEQGVLSRAPYSAGEVTRELTHLRAPSAKHNSGVLDGFSQNAQSIVQRALGLIKQMR
jgi:hypothetical protein